jgi:molybdopterin synthase sulfur carrier subunit
VARVLLFGALADVAGWREREVSDDTLSALRARLGREQPELGEALGRPSVQVALDKALHRGDAALSAAAEVAFLPAMSGG